MNSLRGLGIKVEEFSSSDLHLTSKLPTDKPMSHSPNLKNINFNKLHSDESHESSFEQLPDFGARKPVLVKYSPRLATVQVEQESSFELSKDEFDEELKTYEGLQEFLNDNLNQRGKKNQGTLQNSRASSLEELHQMGKAQVAIALKKVDHIEQNILKLHKMYIRRKNKFDSVQQNEKENWRSKDSVVQDDQFLADIVTLIKTI